MITYVLFLAAKEIISDFKFLLGYKTSLVMISEIVPDVRDIKACMA
jgi:hypothetical protein